MTSNLATIAEYVQQLKSQRALSIIKEIAEDVDISSLVPTQSSNSDLTAVIERQSTVIEQQSAEIAELRKCMLVLAKSAKSVEESNAVIVDGINVIKQQTRKQVLSWAACRREINNAWRSIIDDTKFFNHDAFATAVGRGLQSILSFGTAAPGLVHQAKTEVHNHVKRCDQLVTVIRKYAEVASDHYPNEFKEFVHSSDMLKIDNSGWSLANVINHDQFSSQLSRKLFSMRGL